MESYSAFAQVYDQFMDDISYDAWTKYIVELLTEYGVDNGILLDLGCGTGNITELLADKGYDMIGLDNSEEMLGIANGKRAISGKDILYLNQDMREFELFGTVAAIVSVCDCMNYITEYHELIEVLKLANNYLDPGGIFIFDLKTYRYFNNMGDCVIAENRDNSSFIWENTFYPEECLNEYELTIFVKDDQFEKYEKYTEFHYQKAYMIDQIKQAVETAGLEFLVALNAFTRETATEDCDRIYIIARENGKTK